jgi:hypothetical protein
VTPAIRARPRRWSGVVAWALWTLAMIGLPTIAWLERVQTMIATGGHRPDLVRAPHGGRVYPLSGLIECVLCGRLVVSSGRSRAVRRLPGALPAPLPQPRARGHGHDGRFPDQLDLPSWG